MDFLIEGGLLFTIPLSLIAVGVLAAATQTYRSRAAGQEKTVFWRRTVFHLSLLGLMVGILSHAVSLYQMMAVLQTVEGVSPALVIGGLRVAFIAPIYGLIIFGVGGLLWLVLGSWPATGTATASAAASSA